MLFLDEAQDAELTVGEHRCRAGRGSTFIVDLSTLSDLKAPFLSLVVANVCERVKSFVPPTRVVRPNRNPSFELYTLFK